MTGRELYELWLEELARYDCGADGFDDISELDQASWDGLAERLVITEVKP